MELDHVEDQGGEIEGDGLEPQLPGIDLREIQDVVEDGEQGPTAPCDGVDVVALLDAQGRGLEQLRHAQHPVHGGADLMAHAGEERARRLQLMIAPGEQ